MYRQRIEFDNYDTREAWVRNCPWVAPGDSLKYGATEQETTRARLKETMDSNPTALSFLAIYESEQPFTQREVDDINLFLNIGAGHGRVEIDFNDRTMPVDIPELDTYV